MKNQDVLDNDTIAKIFNKLENQAILDKELSLRSFED